MRYVERMVGAGHEYADWRSGLFTESIAGKSASLLLLPLLHVILCSF
jgi:hypothetical protein